MPVDLDSQPVEEELSAGERTAAAAASPFVPFEQPIFRAVWLANIAANFGTVIQGVAASWLMTTIAASSDLVALVQASTTPPVVIFSLAAGSISDNYDRRVIMLLAQGFMLVTSTALAILAWLGLIGPWSLLAFTFLIGCGTALNNPAWQSSVGDMVP